MPDTPHKQFIAWLAAPQTEPFVYQMNSYHYAILRFQKNADFDYLYCQRQYNSLGIERSGTFEYAGIYCRRDGMIYDDQYNIRHLRHDELMREGAQRMIQRLETNVRREVESAIGNDRSNLRVTELSDQRARDSLDNHIKYCASSEARELFLSSEDGEVLPYRCPYHPPY